MRFYPVWAATGTRDILSTQSSQPPSWFIVLFKNPLPVEIDTGLSMWRLGGLSPWQIFRRVWREYAENGLSARSAQFAFYSMLVMVPLLILIIACIAQLPVSGVMGSFLRVLRRSLPDTAYDLVLVQIRDIQTNSTTSLVSISVFIFIIAGMRLFMTIGEGLNAAFGVSLRYRRIRQHGLALFFTTTLILVLMILLVVLVVAPMVAHWLLQYFEHPLVERFSYHFVRWLTVTLFLIIMTTAIYSLVPAVKVPWRWFSPGNVFAVAGWMIASQGFRFYVANYAMYSTTYGALGGVIVLLLWLYLTGSILFIGGQINGAIYQATGEKLALLNNTNSETNAVEEGIG